MSSDNNNNNNTNKVEFLTPKQLQERDLPNCMRCERLKRNPPGKGYPFCNWCYNVEMPAKIYRSDLFEDKTKRIL